jgi:glycine betaine/choline ABC-type transport system substrate-binding protein
MIARRSCAIVGLILLLASCYDGRRNTIVIGSKNFSEQALLAEIVAQHLEARLHLPTGAAFGAN